MSLRHLTKSPLHVGPKPNRGHRSQKESSTPKADLSSEATSPTGMTPPTTNGTAVHWHYMVALYGHLSNWSDYRILFHSQSPHPLHSPPCLGQTPGHRQVSTEQEKWSTRGETLTLFSAKLGLIPSTLYNSRAQSVTPKPN